MPDAVTLMVTGAFLPTGRVFCVTRITAHTAAVFAGLGFGLGLGVAAGGVNGGVTVGGVVGGGVVAGGVDVGGVCGGAPSAWLRRSR